MSKIIRGARIDQQPFQIKINIHMPIPDVAPAEEISETLEPAPEAEIPEMPQADPAAAIAQAEAEALSMITEAQAQSQQVINEAQAQAQQIISEAQQAATQLKDEAVEQGQTLGYQQGVEQGHQAVAALLAQAEQIVAYAKHEREELIDACERDILELALSVATRVIHTEVTINPEIVLAVVKDAIQKAKDQEQVVIRINPADFETIAEEKQTLQAILRREMGLEIRGDVGVEVGGCVIETDYGAIDARIDTQLETIKNALLGVVKHG